MPHGSPLGSTNTSEVLLLAPSRGAGGGIERYIEAMVEALNDSGAIVNSVAVVDGPDAKATCGAKVRFVIQAVVTALQMRRMGRRCQIIIAHPSLAALAPGLRALAGSPHRPILVLYGQEAWLPGTMLRCITRVRQVEMMAISDFTAGAAVSMGNARVLPPGLSRKWFLQLADVAETRADRSSGPLRVLSVFRLADAVLKGLPELAQAVAALLNEGRPVELVIAGSGRLPEDVAEALTSLGVSCMVRNGLSDGDLADLYSWADVMVLATRLCVDRRRLSGEGFGMVLVEAQLAGAMVIGPAFGGSAGAYVEGMTGLRPSDESSAELQRLLRWCEENREGMADMGHAGHRWARDRFSPGAYRQAVAAVVLGCREPYVRCVSPPDITFEGQQTRVRR
jgi:phosphatidylinositol alpha-1,6-mannosyltransferase